jgi:CDP-4-dehydro-6-deoxyglucose reductase
MPNLSNHQEAITQYANITKIQLLTSNVYKVILESNVDYFTTYKAGQYLKILDDDDNEYCFSIACSPVLSQKTIELHILQIENSQSSKIVFEQLHNRRIRISLPYGDCYIDKKLDCPIIFIAAGTGFAQIKCLIDYCIAKGHKANKWLYWGVETAEQLYMEIPKNWITNKVKYIPVVNNPQQDWNGRQGLVMDAITADFYKHNITANTRVYISGSFNMVKNTSDKLKANLANITHIYSDMIKI